MHAFLELHDPISSNMHAGEIPDSEVDISLEVEQGLYNTMDKLLMMIHELCNIYLECKHIPKPHGCTISSAAQLLYGLHQVMERREKEEVAKLLSRHTAIMTVLALAISNTGNVSYKASPIDFFCACTMQ